MTEQAGAAKRLFDKAEWPEAVVALEAVARGAHGDDDDGNRQMAEYYLAIANYNMKDYDAATDLFLLIIAQPSHLKSFETARGWIPKVASGCFTGRTVRALASLNYNPDAGSCDPDHIRAEFRPHYEFLRARGLVELGEFHEAAKLWKPLRNDVDYGFRARQCLEWISEQEHAEPPEE